MSMLKQNIVKVLPPSLRGLNVNYDALAVTPADGTDLLNGPCVALFITGAGNVNVNLADVANGGAATGTATLTTLGAGQIVNVSATRVLATSTTATGIYALYNAAT